MGYFKISPNGVNKNGKRKQFSQSTAAEWKCSSGVIVLSYYVTIDNQRHQIVLKEEERYMFFLPLSLGNTARHPQVLHPAAGKLNPSGGIGKRGSP
jgi:hypothetical protein